MRDKIKYGGLSGIELELEEFDLGEGVIIRKTFAHLFSPFMVAFSPPTKHGFHGGPWKGAKGGFGFDINIEVEVPEIKKFKRKFNQEDIIWLLSCLIRIGSAPYAMASAISDISFNIIPKEENEPTITPFEYQPRIFRPLDGTKPIIKEKDLKWLKKHWIGTLKLMSERPHFDSALRAFDSATIHGKTSSSLLSLWGAIEQLFCPSPGELRFRVSSNLASYLKEPGEERYHLYKELLKLYNERSCAAHSAKDIDHTPLVQTYVHLRNALLKMIQEEMVPNQKSLESSLFNIEKPPNKT
ncbi:hypothetical protein [Flagellimonas aurea]|uniref:hypothetical protein n=1 Tax=Flagellimonas aurea TaxID=2915619 RepID=UPI0035CF9F33